MPPLVLEPYSRPQVWGGTRLQSVYGKSAPAGVPIGESWEVSGHPLHHSRVAEGPHAGMLLNDLWRRHRQEWCPDAELAHEERFPWLIKLLECHAPSSVQVHPNDEQAARFQPGESGKTEAWFVLDATPESRLYTGWKPGITRAEIERRLDEGTIVEALQAVTPQRGEAYLIPAGLAHAIGAGLVLFEIEQCSDLTWRLFDWNRTDASGKPRMLHREAALACLDLSLPAATAVTPEPRASSQYDVREERLLTTRWFALDRVILQEPVGVIPTDRFSAWFVIQGTGELVSADGTWSRSLPPGQTILVPPNESPLRWKSTSASTWEWLRCTWPDAHPEPVVITRM